ncbi:uncharacterized protein LOC112045845 [Bicyclus anynana]|uniref:Uncharacterized protein LOC112045845 n=1 Tax=Bicyclus anynana TaxID=110368 RepID=A0A6J1MQP5_BICAN|nr:uncharacterized protein LOC112045845 [Bicyclus anynana]
MVRERFCCDDETGEVITYQVNDETGERALVNNLPKIYVDDRMSDNRKLLAFPTGYVNKNKKFRDLKEKIITGANTTSPRMLLVIPTLLIFHSFVCVILMLLEIFLHIRCHKKNKNLKDPNLYYRSPFHVITATFCGWCRECDMASKIGQIQDKRRYKYDYLRGAI